MRNIPSLPHLFLCYLIKNPEIFLSYYKIVTLAKTIRMGTKATLRARFKKQPSDFTFDEMEKLLAIFGYLKSNKGKTSGSRVIYKNGDKRPIMLHKPHPGNVLKSYAMKQVLNDLIEAGFLKL